jgi:hypothetical protein
MALADRMPTSFAAGETLEFRVSLADYSPAQGDEATLFLAGPAFPDDHAFAEGIAGTADGGGWIFEGAAEDTATLLPGTYEWRLRVTDVDGKVRNALSGVVLVEPDIATATGGELASSDEALLVSVRAQIAKRVQADMRSLGENDRQAIREELSELRDLERDLMSRIAARHRGSTTRPNVRAAFVRP